MTLLTKKTVMLMVMLVFFTFTLEFGHAASNDTISKIDQFIEEQQTISKIPGISVIIVDKGKPSINGALALQIRKQKRLLPLILFLS